MSSAPPPNPKAEEARAAMHEYAGLPVVHIPAQAVQHITRDPLSAALLAQAARIERGVCFGINADNTISAAMPSATGQAIVTWRGRDAEDTAAQAAQENGDGKR